MGTIKLFESERGTVTFLSISLNSEWFCLPPMPKAPVFLSLMKVQLLSIDQSYNLGARNMKFFKFLSFTDYLFIPQIMTNFKLWYLYLAKILIFLACYFLVPFQISVQFVVFLIGFVSILFSILFCIVHLKYSTFR